MTEPYQLLPPLADDDLAALRDSIAAEGVLVPIVVDENGDVLDGHTRAAIAAELGIDCPRTVRWGLAQHEKRILSVEMNLARRQLNDYLKLELAEVIKPDYAERARVRRLATQNNKSAEQISKNFDVCSTGNTDDVVAKVVNLGTGQTLRNKVKQKRKIESSPQGSALIPKLKTGELTISQAAREVKKAEDAAKREEQKARTAALLAVGDPEGEVRRADVRRRLSQCIAHISNGLLLLDAEAVREVLEEPRTREQVERAQRNSQAWFREALGSDEPVSLRRVQ